MYAMHVMPSLKFKLMKLQFKVKVKFQIMLTCPAMFSQLCYAMYDNEMIHGVFSVHAFVVIH